MYNQKIVLPGPSSRKRLLDKSLLDVQKLNTTIHKEKGTDYIAEYVQREENKLLQVCNLQFKHYILIYNFSILFIIYLLLYDIFRLQIIIMQIKEILMMYHKGQMLYKIYKMKKQ